MFESWLAYVAVAYETRDLSRPIDYRTQVNLFSTCVRVEIQPYLVRYAKSPSGRWQSYVYECHVFWITTFCSCDVVVCLQQTPLDRHSRSKIEDPSRVWKYLGSLGRTRIWTPKLNTACTNCCFIETANSRTCGVLEMASGSESVCNCPDTSKIFGRPRGPGSSIRLGASTKSADNICTLTNMQCLYNSAHVPVPVERHAEDIN